MKYEKIAGIIPKSMNVATGKSKAGDRIVVLTFDCPTPSKKYEPMSILLHKDDAILLCESILACVDDDLTVN